MLYHHPDPLLEQARRYILNFVSLAHPDWLRVEGVSVDMTKLPHKYHQDFVSHLLPIHGIDISLFSQSSLGDWDASKADDRALALDLLKLLNLPLVLLDRVAGAISICLMGSWFGREILKTRLVRIHDQVGARLDMPASDVPGFFAMLKSHFVQGISLQNSVDYLDVLDDLLVDAGRTYLLQAAAPCAVIQKLLQTKFAMSNALTHNPSYALLPSQLDVASIVTLACPAGTSTL